MFDRFWYQRLGTFGDIFALKLKNP